MRGISLLKKIIVLIRGVKKNRREKQFNDVETGGLCHARRGTDNRLPVHEFSGAFT